MSLKRFIGLFLLGMVFTGLAIAEDDTVPPLSLEDIADITAKIVTLAKTQEPIIKPSSEEDLTEDGYAFVYDFGTLYLNHPSMDEGSTLLQFVIQSEDVTASRNTCVGQTLQDLLASYTSENPLLRGDYNHAVLYLYNELPQQASWAWLARDGQRIQSVQYTLHARMSDGQYSDLGILYTLSSGLVDSIRVFGLTNRVSQSDVMSTLDLVAQSQKSTAYSQVTTSFDGLTLTPFSEADLTFSGIDFLHTSPEELNQHFGEPIEDTQMQDSDGSYVRMVDYGPCEIFYHYDASMENPSILSLTVGTDGFEGPRAIRVGDTFASVLSRFRFGEGEYDGEHEVLYGTPADGNYAFCEYGQDASAVLRYFTKTQDGNVIELMAIFEDMILTEFLVIHV